MARQTVEGMLVLIRIEGADPVSRRIVPDDVVIVVVVGIEAVRETERRHRHEKNGRDRTRAVAELRQHRLASR